VESAPPRQVPDASRAHRRTLLVVVAITVLALVLRLGYLFGAEVLSPLVGDEGQYWNYAWNLVHHQVFSNAEPSLALPAPDAWRGPAYPAFLAACIALAPTDLGAVALAELLQVLLSSLLAPMTIMLARRILPSPWALASGLLVAVWPHLIVFAGTLLSETVFAFALLAAALAVDHAFARDRPGYAGWAGLLAGAAWLVNPILMFFPPVLAALAAWKGKRKIAVAYLLGFLVVVGAWQVRNAAIGPGEGSAQRAGMNFVQGSWPMYHDAYQGRFSSPIAKAFHDQIEEQGRLMTSNPRAGLEEVFQRLGADPLHYLGWYAIQKPWLLWDWSVRIGWGDVYFLETRHSPFDRMLVYRAIHEICRALNPALFGLSLLSCFLATRPRGHGDAAAFAWQACALLFCYLTAVHVVLQAEPRYSIPYRPIEILLAAAAAAAIATRLRRPAKADG
jgi:4-amino-4-deoxy-L-arabinose transferase-like glycosyltransferase